VPSPGTDLDLHIFDVDSYSVQRLGFSNMATPDFDLPSNALLRVSSTAIMDNKRAPRSFNILTHEMSEPGPQEGRTNRGYTTAGRSFNLLTHEMSELGLEEGRTNRDYTKLPKVDSRSRNGFRTPNSPLERRKWTANEDDYLRSQVEKFSMLVRLLGGIASLTHHRTSRGHRRLDRNCPRFRRSN
jgi:hypothetical protein